MLGRTPMVAIYVRQSIDKKDSISIETQIELCRREAGEGGEPRIFEDRGYSGGNTNRPGFQRMLADIRRGEISKVVIYKLDRMSRSLLDFSRLIEFFRQYGVEFQSAQEKFDTSTPIGNAMLSITMVFAQLERETIQQRIRDNYYARGQKGMYLGGKPPFGYRKTELRLESGKTSVLEPVAGEIILVRRIFSRYADGGQSLGAIGRELNAAGGKRFQPSFLSRLLRNPAYVRASPAIREYYLARGLTVTNPAADFLSRNGCYLYGKQPRCLTLAPHEGCVEPEQWLRAQERLAAGASSGPARTGTGELSWLSGLVLCGFCGSHMSVKTAVNRDRKTGEIRARYAYLSCNGRKTGLCETSLPKRGIPLGQVEAAVEKRLLRYARYQRIPAYEPPDMPEREEASLQAELAATMEKIRRLVEAVRDGGAVSARYLEQELSILDGRRLEQERRLASLRGRAGKTRVLIPELLAGWEGFHVSLKKRLAREFIEKILLFHREEGDRLQIWWRYRFTD